ncbi:hypothetical protein COU01_01185 [Candidatus Falkowbacteria bacterium CG10_big_fil_rev_8_21_14_0_10_44_15]|uniref:DUF5673 domain-containing protein n=1 Tax=Candidatus Falkowbacteria bacterium CG10_big_fil_rev_8_21_14_0_10_44_15 TaxID=1974569 RepID=A0A2H0V2H9_9BACT|nr:MAG: hypothetical protein COU01_01185 [Candidatus Falkowbacteria bacterium CG10_big_fil_rev_8_21_14_0_10_44_15]
MPQINPPVEQYDEIMAWSVPEFDKHERSRAWYVGAIIFALVVLTYSFWTANFLFVVIIVLAAAVMMLNDGREPDKIKFAVSGEGLIVGKKFIDYDELKNFSIVYKPRQGVKKLYFEFKNVVRPRLSIYLDNMNPLPIRETLLNYLPEDLERENEPLSEQLGRLFKI